MSADGLDGGIAALGVELAHDTVNVILDGKFGEAQVRGNFLVGEALS